MVLQYSLNQSELILKSDLAGEFPVYIYWSKDQSTVLYSTSIIKLLNDKRLSLPLKVSNEGLSFLLQSGAVPPPKTIYEDIYIISIGDEAKVITLNDKVQVTFSHKFPFMNTNRLPPEAMRPDESLILSNLAEATINRIDKSKQSFLFHSAGKDSNSIALALAEAGYQDKVTLICHKSKGRADESEISAKIARQLGFKHKVLNEVDNLQVEHFKHIKSFFNKAPFPCTDKVTLAYPLYVYQLPKLHEVNIIDGMGNDVFMGHIPSQSEYTRQKISKYLKHGRFLFKFFLSESLFNVAGRTRAEWTGLSGLSFSDAKKILPNAFDVSDYWLAKDSSLDYLDLRSAIRGTIIDQEIFTRKVRNFTDSVGANMILPWTNHKIAEYFAKMPETYLFDRKKLKNKLILRKILKDRIGLDSDKLGKFGWGYHPVDLLINNLDFFLKEIINCKWWNENKLKRIIDRMINKAIKRDNSYSYRTARTYIFRLYLISAWLNKNVYTN